MTNGWVDIKNTEMMLVMGGNPAENHPCGFKWAIEAKRGRNAKLIVVDPVSRARRPPEICSARFGLEAISHFSEE
jgi:anaerobic selenocysteine-containing dehydrogenase